MKRIDTHSIKRLLTAGPVFCLLAAILLVGCSGQKSEEEQQRTAERLLRERSGKTDEGPRVPQNVADSLRVMKKRYKITRDEYWLNKGGVLANEHYELWYPPGPVTVTHGMYSISQLEIARERFARYFGRELETPVTVILAMTMSEYTDETGNQWWIYSRTRDDEIIYQPIDILYQRKLMNLAIRRGYYEWGIGELSGGRAPQWLIQGLSSVMSDEEQVLENQMTEFQGQDVKMNVKEIEDALKKRKDRKSYRLALYCSWRMVRRLSAAHGQEKMADVVVRMGEGQRSKDAFEDTFGEPYDRVVDYALDFKVNE